MTLPVWLRTFLDPNGGINWAELMAASTLVAIPVVVFFLIVQRPHDERTRRRGGQGLMRAANDAASRREAGR